MFGWTRDLLGLNIATVLLFLQNETIVYLLGHPADCRDLGLFELYKPKSRQSAGCPWLTQEKLVLSAALNRYMENIWYLYVAGYKYS